MIVTDLGEEGKRADALGKLGLSYGVGMVIGPFLGGLVTKYSRYRDRLKSKVLVVKYWCFSFEYLTS